MTLAPVTKSIKFGLKEKETIFIFFLEKKMGRQVLHIRLAFYSKSL